MKNSIRFVLLSAALFCGATSALAQSQKPAPLVKPALQVKPNQGKPSKRGMTANPAPAKGTASTTSLSLVVGGSDDCNTPDAIAGEGLFVFDQTSATTGIEGQNEYNCYAFGSSVVDNDVWFAWTAATTDTFYIESCNITTTDTKMAVYAGNTCPAAATSITCNDDNCGLQSQVSFGGTAGSTYMLQVGTFPGAIGGTGQINIFSLVAPPNDDCATPATISGTGSFAFDNFGGTTGAEGQNEYSCYAFGSSAVDRDVWFSWTAPSTDTFRIETCNLTSVDTKMAVWPGGVCPTAGTVLDCNDDTCGLQSSLMFSGVGGSSYMLQVGTFPGASGGTGNFDITVFTPAANDDCSNPTAISGAGTFLFDQTTATTGAEGQNEYICYDFGSSAVDNDVWFAWTSPTTNTYSVETCNLTSTDTKIGVYPGIACPTSSTSIGCNDDNCGLQSAVWFSATSGSTYMLQVGTFPGALGGSGSINLYPIILPPNDDCATPDAISGSGTFPFDNTLSTTGTDGQLEAICYAYGTSAVENDIWFTWTADFTGNAQMTTCTGSTVDTRVAVYPGTTCPTAGSSLACNDDVSGCTPCGSNPYASAVEFSATLGSSYLFQIGTFPNATGGAGSFSVAQFTPPPVHPHDECATPLAITGSGNFAVDTTGAAFGTCGSTTGTYAQGEGLCYAFGTSNVNNDVWFEWTAVGTGLATVTACNSGISWDTKMAAYPGGVCPPVPNSSLACNDDTCGLQSEIVFNATAGTSYLIQFGSFAAGGSGDGAFDIDVACNPCEPGVTYCVGDGSGSTPCPCGNPSGAGGGCANGTGNGAVLTASGGASVTADTLVLQSTNLLPNQPCLFFQGNNAINGGDGIQFGDGLRCAGGGVIRVQVRFADASGNAETSLSVSVKGGCSAGDVKRYQNWYRDPQTSPCGAQFNLSNGYEITWQL
jgi:hypothetical protein